MPEFPLAKVLNPAFRRSIFTVGLLMRHFDFKNPLVYGGDAGKFKVLQQAQINVN